jgi:hypothetical protein
MRPMTSKARQNPVAAELRSFSRLILVALTVLFISSCSGSLFKVKPVTDLPPMPANVASANLGSISFRAAPMLSDEESQALFETNLQLAGLLPVRVEIKHNGGEVIDLKMVRFHLTDAAGTKWKAIPLKQAIARILKANGVSSYNPTSRKNFEHEFRAYELDLKTPITTAEGRREGLVIFLAPDKAPVSSPQGLALTIDGFSQPVTLRLN